jgi:hypothetical protein
MQKIGTLAGGVLFLAACALAVAPAAEAKGGRGGGGGGGHAAHFGGGHGGGHAVHFGGGHGKFGGGRPHFAKQHFAGPRVRGVARHVGRPRHGFAGRAVARHQVARPALRGAVARQRFRPGVTGRAVQGPAFRQGLAARSPSGFQPGLPGRLFARPAFRVAFWPGPFFWPYAADDVFWPTAYDDIFWAYGPADMIDGVFQPYGYGPYAYAPYGVHRGVRAERGMARGAEIPGLAQLCSERTPGLANIAVIEQELRPTPEQRAALDELKAAEAKAAEILRAACPSDVPVTPTARLDAMARWIDAMRQAVRTVRPALERFYDALSDEQKARFVALPSGERDTRSSRQAPCNEPGRAFASVRMDRIAHAIRATATQLAALDELSAASAEAAKTLQASCPDETVLTPTGRIAAIEKRLDAQREALDILRPALERFYGSLTDEQKARFNQMEGQRGRRAG